MLTEAKLWHNAGISVVPIQAACKHFDVNAMRNRGYTLASLREQLPTSDDLKYWFENSSRNMAVICNGMVVVDFDSEEAYQKFKIEYPTICCTLTVKSPRGYHLHYLVENEVEERFTVTWPDVEIKCNGQAVVTAGDGYEVIESGLLNKYSMLKIRDAFVLPMVKRLPTPHKEKKFESDGSAISSFMRCQSTSSTDPISKIKQSLPISHYLQSLGHELKSTGDGKYIIKCPFHDDNNPSFWIDDNYNNCNCLKPDCQQSRAMDILDLHQKLNHCSLGKAIGQLASRLGF